MDPLLTVIVPVHDRTCYLRESIGSVLDAVKATGLSVDDEEVEIIVPHNPSPNGAPGMEQAVSEASCGRADYERHDSDLGIYGSINAAIRAASGTFIHIVSDDDYILPGFYRAFLEAREARTLTFCTLFRTQNELPDHQDADRFWDCPPFAEEPGVVDLLDKLVEGNILQLCSAVFSRRLAIELGLFREDLPYTADWEFWVRLSFKVRWHYVDKHLAVYRLHPGQAMHGMNDTGETARSTRRAIESIEQLLPASKHRLVKPMKLTSALRLANAAMISMDAGEMTRSRIFLEEAARILA